MDVVKRFSAIDLVSGPAGPAGPTGAPGPINVFVTTNASSVAPGSTGTLTTIDAIAENLGVNSQIFVAGSITPGYLDVVGFVSGTTLTVANNYGDNTIQWGIGDNVVIVGVQRNGGPNVISRGNPGTSETLDLVSLNTVHYYTGSGAYIDISTGMVENGVYEILFNASGGSASNNDMYLYPNSNTGFGASTFYTVLENCTGLSGGLNYTANNSSRFYFDYYGGSFGWNPVGRITIYNVRNSKKIRVQAGDTASTVIGSGYWTDGSGFTTTSGSPVPYDTATEWTTIGRLEFGARTYSNWNIWVKRIA
jgi:hypothetical protein